LILLEKIKSFKLEFTDSKPTLNFAFVFDDNNVSSRFDLKKLINKSYSKFRVGFESVNSNLNDLIFSNKIKKYKNFKSELIKYLKMIK
jgi:hypothetical protein